MHKRSLTVAVIFLLLTSCSGHDSVQISNGKCWPQLKNGDNIEGSADVYVGKYLVSVESRCSTDVLIVEDGKDKVPQEYDLFRNRNRANGDIIGIMFPANVAGHVELRSRGLALQAVRIQRTGPIEVRKASQLRRVHS